MKLSVVSGLAALSLSLFAPACSSGSKIGVNAAAAEAAPSKTGDRKPAPAFTLKDADGREVKLADYKGKVVLLNFWATWCGPCKFEIPWFIEFEKQYKDRGFAVLGVAMDEEGWEVVKPYISDKKVNYRVVMGSDPVAQLYGGIDSLPTTFMIDREGRIAFTHIGLQAKSNFEDDIKALLD